MGESIIGMVSTMRNGRKSLSQSLTGNKTAVLAALLHR
jgi:hypothetical protein